VTNLVGLDRRPTSLPPSLLLFSSGNIFGLCCGPTFPPSRKILWTISPTIGIGVVQAMVMASSG
jgi:hypothetical protein